MVNCTCCGEVFEPRNSLHKHCSKKCAWTVKNRKRSASKREKRDCPGCGKDISGEYAKKKYCSDACRCWVANGNTELRVLGGNCMTCGKEIHGRAGKKYCGRPCKVKASEARRVRDDRARYLKERDRRISYAKAYALDNPWVGQATKRKRRALVRANGSFSFTSADWKRCVDIADSRCFYCDEQGLMTMDHVVPVTRGGTHGAGNIVPACISCNASKNNNFISEWKFRKRRSLAA